MAAGALSRNREVAGVRTTRGLYLVFTLLCLVCLSSSLMNKEKLEKAKKLLKSAQIRGDKIKEDFEANREFGSEMMDAYMGLIDPLIAMAKKSAPDFPPLMELIENLKTFMEKSKSFIEKGDAETAARIQRNEETLRKMKELIKHLEENQYEL